MAYTPAKSVQWANTNEVKEFAYGSPYSEASSSDSINASSTLQYINSQLIAHGFTRGGGVSFDGLSKEDADRLSKCMLGMLSQRNDDMSRAEDLSTKLRTLSYEHERLASMHRSTSEQLATAERETNLFKTRLAASNKSLQASETAHKTTSAELQRARSTMQSVRQTYAAELKRREKETEKMIDRWQKISDTQTKLGSIASGIKFKTALANPVISSRDGEVIGKGSDLLEDALDEAQMARKELMEENTSLKNVVLSAANELSRICHVIRTRLGESPPEEAPHFTLSDLFSISAPESASEKFNRLLTSFQEIVTRFGVDYNPESTTPAGDSLHPHFQAVQRVGDEISRVDAKEVLRLQNTIVDLRRQLEQARTQKETSTYADQAQAIIRRFLNSDDETATVHERQLLEKIRKELDNARRKVDEAALTLKDEKAWLEEEREAFYREQRLWRSQMGIPQPDDGPPRQATGLGTYFDAPAEPLELPMSPPRPPPKKKKNASPKKTAASPRRHLAPRSPAKTAFAVGKMPKKSRIGHTPKKGSAGLLGASNMRQKVIPPMETEVMPVAPTLPTAASSQSLIVPNSFVLPPASPHASIPPNEPEFLPKQPLGAPSFGNEDDKQYAQFAGESDMDTEQPLPRRPFPVAKPLAQHMIHAYSPARPSPLSRILMRGNSPTQRGIHPMEGAAFNGGDDNDVLRADGPSSGSGLAAPMMSEEELGIDEVTEESPLRAKHKRILNKAKKQATTNNRTKPKASTLIRSTNRETDKENGFSKLAKARTQPAPPATQQSTSTRPLLSGKGGARRVPIGSAEAAPIGPGWK